MTKQWFLLKGIDQDANVMYACADVLRGLSASPPRDWPKDRLEEALRDCLRVLDAMETSARIELGEVLAVDPYFYRLSLRVGQALALPPGELQSRLTATITDLRNRKLTSLSAMLLKAIVRTSQKLATDRWTELRSSPITAFR